MTASFEPNVGKSVGTVSVRRDLGAKRAKCKFRIREHLENNGITYPVLAAKVGVSVPMVCNVINGASHSKRVLAGLRAEGVPEEYLFDPYVSLPVTQEVA